MILTPNNLRRHRLKKPRIAMWLWPWGYDSKTECDTIISACKQHGITDIYAAAIDDNVSPKKSLGYSSLCNQTTITWDGVLPFYYLCREANRIGVKVHAWWIIYPWTYWGGATAPLVTPLVDNATNHDTSSGGSTINFSTAAVRQTVVNVISEFARYNPRAAGINLDYIRTDGTVTGQTDADITALVSELRTAVPDREISVCALSEYSTYDYHQDVVDWLSNKYIDSVSVMAYYTNAAKKMWYWDQCDWVGRTHFVGIGTEENSGSAAFNATRPSDNRASLRQYFDMGYENFCLFCWNDNMDATDRQDVLDDYLLDDVRGNAPYPAVSSVEVVPASYIELIIGGSTYTTQYADVTDHTSTGTLKGHIEGVEGQRPWIHYQRPTSSTIAVQVGDWEV